MAAAAGTLLLVAAGCRQGEGGLHVIVDGPLERGRDYDRLAITVANEAEEELLTESLEGDELLPLPASFNFVSGPKTPAGTRLAVTARAHLAGALVAEARGVGQLLTGKGGELTLWLGAASPDGGEPDGGELDGGEDGGAPDGGDPDGGPTDGGAPDGGRPDAGELGAPCLGDGECTTGRCVDGVCCESACANPCDACNVSGSEGRCVIAPAGTDSSQCGAYACSGLSTGCPSQCASDLYCNDEYYCRPNSRCTLKKSNGTACGAANECLSGFCVEGVCCSSGCAERCDSCTLTGQLGTCSIVPATGGGSPSCSPYRCSGTSNGCATSCTLDTQCAATAYCEQTACVAKKSNGAACAAGRECLSANCVDGYCCSTACAGACDACNRAGLLGTCSLLPAGAEGTPSCSPYLCSGSSSLCPTSCSSDAGCALPYRCSSLGTCIDKLSTLKDDFDDNVIATSKWSAFQGVGVQVAESTAQLEVSVGAGSAGFAGVTSAALHDATGSSVVVELKSVGTQTAPGLAARLQLHRSSSLGVALVVSEGRLRARRLVGPATWTELASTSFSSSTMRYLRLREQGGTTYWEYSQDRSFFNELFSEPNTFAMNEVYLELSGGTSTPDSSSHLIAFDNVNLP